MDETLLERITPVAKRLRFRRVWVTMGITWFILSLVVISLTFSGYFDFIMPNNRGLLVAAASALISLFAMLVAFAYGPSLNRIGCLIEEKYPELDSRLLTAMEIRPNQSRRYDYLQQDVLRQAFAHSLSHQWNRIVPMWQLFLAPLCSLMALSLLVAATMSAMSHVPDFFAKQQRLSAQSIAPENLTVTIEPGDTEVELNSSLLVLAKFEGGLPNSVKLEIIRDQPKDDPQLAGPSFTSKGNEPQDNKNGGQRTKESTSVRMVQNMEKRLDDPVYSSRINKVDGPLKYRVIFDGVQSDWFSVATFTFPALERGDATLTYPKYTNLSDQSIVDVRRLSAVEGTNVALSFHVNKSLSDLRFECIEHDGVNGDLTSQDMTITTGLNDKTTIPLSFHLTASSRFKLHLTDLDGRVNRLPPIFSFKVLPNRPPKLKILYPGRDLEVSALEELLTSFEVWDDFGVQQTGVSVNRPGHQDLEFRLGQNLPGQTNHSIQHMIYLESMQVQPDDLISYYFWADDLDAAGETRRTVSDMYFAEVRPFDQIFRQGQQPTASQMQQQQQQQGQQAGGQNAQQAAELVQQQKQAIAATWNLVRKASSDNFNIQDIEVVKQAQQSIADQTDELSQQLTDAKSKTSATSALQQMELAIDHLQNAGVATQQGRNALQDAIGPQQAAYQNLLQLREREFEVVQSQQQQQQSQQSQSSSNANSRSQQQLQQLSLSNQQNRYEQERTATDNQQNQSAEAQEDRQVLNRLSELAKRQEDLVQRINELQSALQEAESQEAEEEMQLRLKSLQEQQQNLLRDADELADRMQQEENQQRMSQENQQLQNARQNMQQANQSLQNNELSQAAAEGRRAQEGLDQLEDEFQRRTSSQFNQAMQAMRQEAREIEAKQEELINQMNNDQQNVSTRPSLRETPEEDSLLDQLTQQQERIQQLRDSMKETIEQAEESEPLLAEDLYETYRQSDRNRPDQQMQNAADYLQRGWEPEARGQAEEAQAGIEQLREGIEKAAESVLGDELQSLRAARDSLQQLEEEVKSELQANNETDEPSDNSNGSGQARSEQVPSDQEPDDRDQQNDAANEENQTAGNQDAAGQNENARDGQSRPTGAGQNQRPGNQDNQANRSGNPTTNREPNQQDRQNRPSGEYNPQSRSENQQSEAAGEQDPNGGAGQQQQQQQQQGQQGQRSDSQQLLDQWLPGDGNFSPNQSGDTGNVPVSSPFSGEDYREWIDRLRDVEQMISDPELRAEASRIREEAREIRRERNRHSAEPNWDLIRMKVAAPLNELQRKVAEEILRRTDDQQLVPTDRDPVPNQYRDAVQKYYQRLGIGK